MSLFPDMRCPKFTVLGTPEAFANFGVDPSIFRHIPSISISGVVLGRMCLLQNILEPVGLLEQAKKEISMFVGIVLNVLWLNSLEGYFPPVAVLKATNFVETTFISHDPARRGRRRIVPIPIPIKYAVCRVFYGGMKYHSVTL